MVDHVFAHDSYKAYLTWWLAAGVGNGRGALSRVANYLKVHPSFISQVINGDKDLSQEQAFKLTDLMGLSGVAKDYFLTLVLKAKAGTPELGHYYQQKIAELKSEGKRIKTHVGQVHELSQTQQARFYSDAVYSQARLLASLPLGNSVEKLAQTLGLPVSKMNDVVGFLLETSLLKRTAGGDLALGANRTHLPNTSPYINAHHRNWRLKVTEFYNQMDEDDLAFTAPLTISKEDFRRLRGEILALIRRVTHVVEKSQDEQFVVLNIDWVAWH